MDVKSLENGTPNVNLGAFHILRLPYEIRILIYKKLDVPEILNLRSASSQIKAEIDDTINFKIRIDDTTFKKYRNLLGLHVESCKIDNWTCLPNKVTKFPMFTWPAQVKHLTLNGQIKSKLLAHLISTCSQLETLTCTHEALGGCPKVFQSKQVQQHLSTKLQNLTSLSLQFLRYPVSDLFIIPDPSISIFLQYTFPKLKSFKLDYTVYGREWIPLCQFLARHSTTLKQLYLFIGDPPDGSRLMHQSVTLDLNLILTDDIKLLFNRLQLKEFTIHDNILYLNPTIKKLILDILLAQRNSLEVLQFSSNGQITMDSLSLIIRLNEKSLISLTIDSLMNTTKVNNNLENVVVNNNAAPVEINVPFDMKLFSHCKNLQTLSISAYVERAAGQNQDIIIPTAVNLYCLPQNLISLHLSNYKFDNVDFETGLFAFTKSCPNLQNFVLIDSTYSVKNSYLLNTLLNHCTKLKYIHVRPIIYSSELDDENNSELTELVKLYQKYLKICFDPSDDLDGFELSIS